MFQALGLDSANEKGLYRRGEAQLLMNEFESAKGDFEKVLAVNPQNKAARLQISMCQKKAKEHNERDRRIYANMFTKFAEQDAKVCVGRTGRRLIDWNRLRPLIYSLRGYSSTPRAQPRETGSKLRGWSGPKGAWGCSAHQGL